ncbi:uncharacterized protein LOC130771599 [Actinidia eriantha]|uniref:uncharacterized protein LOC130771599 n=1 Tax=Actinidia eriantha TaxID=165200 RepID=UPI0025857424|nr:uncharacterized protein LOC130771599 [Actinidia eriantha]
MDDAPPATVQHVTKASSDQLLQKFAQVGPESEGKKVLQLAKRRRNRIAAEIDDQCESPSRRRLLFSPEAAERWSSSVIRRLGIGRSRTRVKEFKNKSILGTIGKTWRRTVDGASKVFLEKHHNRHKRLINDIA